MKYIFSRSKNKQNKAKNRISKSHQMSAGRVYVSLQAIAVATIQSG